jgi:hypothetical protein
MSLGIILGFLICMSKCGVVLDYFVLCVFVFYDAFPSRDGRFTHIRFSSSFRLLSVQTLLVSESERTILCPSRGDLMVQA